MKMNNYNEEFKKMIVEMYEDGEPVSKLSDEYDVSRPTIYDWIKLYKTIEISDDETTDLNEVMLELEGIYISERTVGHYMKDMDIASVYSRKHKHAMNVKKR